MNRQRIYSLALGLAMCCAIMLNPAQISLAASSTKTTTSFSYSSKVVGNTVVISGNSTTKQSSTTAAKTTVTKTPASTKAPVTTKTPASIKAPTSSKTPAKAPASKAPVAKSPAAKAPAKKPTASTSSKSQISTSSSAKAAPAKSKLLLGTAPKSTLTYLVPVKKPTIPVVFKLTPKPVQKTPAKVIVKTAPKAVSPPKKITIKVPASTSLKSSTASAEASFSPETITAAAFPASVSVSDPVYLTAPASAHYRVGTILGRVAQVRFTPIDSTWSFGDGSQSTGINPTHSFSAAGTYSASVAVRYQVSYRFVGESNWTNEAGQITLTDQVQIRVVNPGSAPAQPSVSVPEKPYLVGENCNKNPSAFGC